MSEDIKDAIEAGQAVAARTDLPNGRGVAVVVPEGAKPHIFDFEHLEAHPRRRKGKFAFHDAASFTAYVAKHRTDDSLVVADREHHKIEAALDGHGDGDDLAGWHQHRAVFDVRATKPWLTWNRGSGQYMSQSDFASFIEDNLPDIVEPEGATILEVAKTLQIKNNVNFKSAVRLESGEQQFTYEDNHTARAGAGMVAIPTTFILGIEPFEGSEKYKVTARLRYRLSEGRLTLGYALVRPDRVQDDAFDTIVGGIGEELAHTVLAGTLPTLI